MENKNLSESLICVLTGCGDSISFPNNGFPVKVNLHSRTAQSALQPEIEMWNILSVAYRENTIGFSNNNPSFPLSQHGLCKRFMHTLSENEQPIKDVLEKDSLQHWPGMSHETLLSCGHKYFCKLKPGKTNTSYSIKLSLDSIILFCFWLIYVNLLLHQ